MAKLDLSDPEFTIDPHPMLHRLRATDPVHRTAAGEWALTRYVDVEWALRDPACGTGFGTAEQTRAQYGDSPAFEYMSRRMSRYDPPDHARLRGLVARAFTPRRIAALQPRIEALTEELLDAIEDRREVDFVAAVAHPLPSRVICELLGVPVADQALHSQWTPAIQRGLSNTASPTERDEANAAVGHQWTYLQQLVAERRASPGDDLLSAMVTAEEAGDRLTTEEVIATAIMVFSAGHSTTRDLLGSGLLRMLTVPGQFASLAADPSLASAAVEESLRYDPSLTMVRRRALKEKQLGEATIHPGETILALIIAANRDPAVFNDPDAFTITRADNRPLSFGGGIHYCLGSALARMEGEIVFRAVARRFPMMTLANNHTHSRDTPVFRGPEALPVHPNHKNHT